METALFAPISPLAAFPPSLSLHCLQPCFSIIEGELTEVIYSSTQRLTGGDPHLTHLT